MPISDPRSSHPSRDALSRLAAEARVGSMLSGKAGIVLVHAGDGADQLNPRREAVGAGAGVLVLDRDRRSLRHVIGNGRVMMRDGEIVQRGFFD